MPADGDVNPQFAVYRSSCCRLEIVLPAGAFFPDCPNHPHRPLQWVWVEAVNDVGKGAARNDSKHITKEYLLELLHEHLDLSEEQFRHCAACDDCTELVTTFLLELIRERDRAARASSS
jgi:hypothetical protein